MKKHLLIALLFLFATNFIYSQSNNVIGSNVNNQIHTPVPQFVAAGHWHSMFLCNDGTVNAFGRNDENQLGDTLSADRLLPVQIAGLSGITSIAVKFKTSMALKSDSTVWAWGFLYGTNPPAQIAGLTGIVNIAAGNEHCMALRSDSTVWTWGYNTYGQLGSGNTSQNFTPAMVSGLSGIIDISGGDYHSLALKSDGTVWGWGNNDYGGLGDSTQTQRNHPVQVHGLNNVISISCGLYCNYALKSDGTIWSWGENFNGKLGDGTQTTRWTPVQVIGLTNMVAVSAGQYNGLAVKADGTVWAWGDNNDGQLGNGNQVDQLIAIQVPGIDSVVEVSAGGYQSFALRSNGTLWGWGLNMQGQLGNTSVNGIAFAPAQTMGLCNVNTSVADLYSHQVIDVFPNPSNGKINVSTVNSEISISHISVYDVYGKKILDFTGNDKFIDLSGQPKGMYLLVMNVEGKFIERKLVID